MYVSFERLEPNATRKKKRKNKKKIYIRKLDQKTTSLSKTDRSQSAPGLGTVFYNFCKKEFYETIFLPVKKTIYFQMYSGDDG